MDVIKKIEKLSKRLEYLKRKRLSELSESEILEYLGKKQEFNQITHDILDAMRKVYQ
ncbi:hypothetical protein [Rossellomorea vietnamensis]|uniref:hypothetical protein n=1 Tax=Rossellomorea vietnamensis TaxID=218284 RepID=UPI001653DF33|nr:hypothetical protein [Rossellomorea vietnamensis]